MKILSFFSRAGKNKEVSKNHVKKLLELAHVDGHFDSREEKLLEIIAKREKIGGNLIKKLVTETNDQKMHIPDEEELKFNQFYDLVKMMLADEYIHALEMDLIRSWGERFGYNKKHLNELIESIAENIKVGHDAPSTRDRVKWMFK
jgi:uncharacterized tellurite resistance protein B-like protein